MGNRRPRKNRREVVFQPRVWRGMHGGAMQLVRAIAPTLGPCPRVVAFSPEFGHTQIDLYDNGGEIARRLMQLRDRDEDVGAMLLRDMLWRLQNQVGDGVATAAVLFGAVYSAGVRYLAAGGSARRLQTCLEEGLEVMLAELSGMTTRLEGKASLARVAESISADQELSRYLGEIFDIIGSHGRLELRKGRSTGIEREYVEGMYWERGLMSRQMIWDLTQVRSQFENPAIVISDLEIAEPHELLPVLEMAVQSGMGSLLLVAAKLSDRAIGFLLANNRPEQLVRLAAVTTPEHGKDQQAAALQDMAVLTGGRAFIKAAGDTFAGIRAQDVGRARRAWADLRNFGIIGGQGDARGLRQHIQELQAAYEHAGDPVLKEQLRQRIGKLRGGSATLWVGDHTEMRMERRMEAARRTAAAMRLALEEGVAPGGGAALLACRPALRQRLEQAQDANERAAYAILIEAAAAPTRAIAANAGADAAEVMAELRIAGPGHAFDALRQQITPIADLGLYDPAGVLKAALFGAVRTAALALTVDVMVHHAEPEQAQPLRPTARMKL